MYYRRRASPKHRYSIIEVDYGGGGHRTWLKDQTINCCVSRGAPASVYKGSREGGRPAKVWSARRSPTPSGSRTPPFPSWNRIREKEKREGKKERGGRPPCPKPIRFGPWGARPTLPLLPSISTKAHVGPLSPRGVPVTSRYSGKIPISPGTLPISKHRLPIYPSLCLDHFETPRHVRDHIRDSEQPSVHQNA